MKKIIDISLSNKEANSMFKSIRAVLEYTSFTDTARLIFDEACFITGAKSGYVALLSADGSENEVLFLEAGGMPCTVDPNLPMPIRGLREQSYKTGKVVYDNDFMKSEWAKFMPPGHACLQNVMFAPLTISGKVEGIMGMANKSGDFTERDAQLAGVFGEFAAIALKNSRDADALKITVDSLKKALGEVKVLEGIIPICAKCKKIRNDKGYWEGVEKYVKDHSKATFSHGICPQCSRKLYPDYQEEA